MDPLQKILVVWNKVHIIIEVEPDCTVGDLKCLIYKKTGVNPLRQTFINLELKENNIPDTCKLTELELPNNSVVLLNGEPDEDQPSTSGISSRAMPVPSIDASKMPLQEMNTTSEQQSCSFQIHPRPGKYLLVLDVDLAIYDCSEEAETSGYRAGRPHLQQFLTTVYEDYDIIIWSATDMSFIAQKMQFLGITNNPNYTILSYFDRNQMITALVPGLGNVQVKDLQTVWHYFDEYNYKNTVICDDQPKNFFMTPANGIQVTRYSYINYETDTELLQLAKYLRYIANFCDLSSIDHSCWKECIKVTF